MIILIGSKTNKQSQPLLPSSRDDINGIRNQFCGRPPAQSQSSYIWDVLSCCLSGFRNVIPATTAATARSVVAIRGPFVFYKGSRWALRCWPKSVLVYRSKQVWIFIIGTGSKFYEAPILFNSSLSNIWPRFVTPRVVTSGVTHLSLCIRCVTQSRVPNKEVFNNTPTGYFRLELWQKVNSSKYPIIHVLITVHLDNKDWIKCTNCSILHRELTIVFTWTVRRSTVHQGLFSDLVSEHFLPSCTMVGIPSTALPATPSPASLLASAGLYLRWENWMKIQIMVR